jgi:glycosyltransferase involved in cell wall biosynthesis
MSALVATVTDTPLVITNHGLFSQTAPKWVQRVFVPTVARFTLNAADRVLCYTETDRDRLADRGISTEVSVVHNGIDCSKFDPSAGTKTEPQLLFVGRLKRSKGVDTLLDAFAILHESFPDLTLTVVGDGPLRSTLETRCRDLELADVVTFTGNLDNEDVPAYYAESTVFALPSENEGLPRTVLEALACETPVVTSDLPQLEPVVEDVGLTVPTGDARELANAIATLLEDPEQRKQMGERGRERVVSEYSWAETVRQTTAVYHELLQTA